MTGTQHTTRFVRNPATGAVRALCTCGWTLEGERDEIQCRAATHDLDDDDRTGKGN